MQNSQFRYLFIFLSVATGFAAIFTLIYRKQFKYYNSEDILKQVKSRFNNVEASYILHIPKTHQKFDVETKVFHGGITTIYNDQPKNYEFIADAFSGQIIDIYEI